jgi:hypothetical protein
LVLPSWGWIAWLIYPAQFLRLTKNNSGPLAERATLAWFLLLGRFSEATGLVRFWRDRLLSRSPRIIEYK